MGSSVKWVIEKDLFHNDVDSIQQACQRNSIDYQIVDYVPFQDEYVYINERPVALEKIFLCDRPTIFYGSLNLAAKINRLFNTYPGTYATLNKYKCTEYYPYIGKYLLNNEYTILPFGELLRLKFYIFAMKYGVHNQIFMRPNDGVKSFTGKVFNWDTFEDEFYDIKYNKPNPSDLVIISTPKNIYKEWRLVVADGKVIAGSQYKRAGKLFKDINVPERVISFGNEIAALYQPDKAFVIDVCSQAIYNWEEEKYPLSVVEINSFSCSGFYNCDRDIIVQEVTKLVQKDYEDVYSNI